MSHPQAEILRAIADVKPLQFREIDGRWLGIGWQQALEFISEGQTIELRVKPATIMLNGTELPKPMQWDNVVDRQFPLTINSHGMALDKAFWFNTREDRDAVYSKLVEVLGS